jgi:cytochrome bd ubiquinol oxidase subunit II
MNSIVDNGIAVVLLLTVAAYSTAGGTDYGAGIWDLLAGRFQHTDDVRALIDEAMAPVWEANNVWLVFAAVICWTGLPVLFESVFLSLYPLFALAMLGLILRGAFFAFRKAATTPDTRLAATRVFGIASLLAPFAFAAVLGAIASGKVGAGSPVVPVWQACLDPLAVSFGVVAMTATAFSGASFLVGDARRFSPPHAPGPDLVEYFRQRAVIAAIVLLVVGTGALAVIGVESPAVFRGMAAGLGLPFAIVAVLATLAVAFLLWRRIYLWYRTLTVIAVGSFVFAWGVGQAPYVLPGRLTIEQAAGSPATELVLLVIAVVALVLVIPSLMLLYLLDQRSDLQSPV